MAKFKVGDTLVYKEESGYYNPDIFFIITAVRDDDYSYDIFKKSSGYAQSRILFTSRVEKQLKFARIRNTKLARKLNPELEISEDKKWLNLK